MSADAPAVAEHEPGRDWSDLAPVLMQALVSSDMLLLAVEARTNDLGILFANPAMCRTLRCVPGDLAGSGLASHVVTDRDADRTAYHALLAAAHAGQPRRTELRCRTAEGAILVLGLHLIPEQGRHLPRRFVVIGRDLTQVHRQRERDEQVQGLLSKVFAVADTPIYITDLDGRIMMANPAFERLVRVPAGSLTGVQSLDCYDAAAHAAILAKRAQQTRDLLDYTVPVVVQRSDGGRVPCDVAVSMIRRQDLQRFRIMTVKPAAEAPAAPRPVAVGGRIQLIGLDEVRDMLGPRWAEVKSRALATAEHILRRHLRPGDTMSLTAEQDFVVCFAGATEDEADLRAASIGRAIRARLIGDGLPSQATRVLSAASALPPEAAGCHAAQIGPVVRATIEARMQGLQQKVREALQEALQATDYQQQAVFGSRQNKPGTLVQLPPRMARAIDAAFGLLPDEETSELDPDGLLLGFALQCAAESGLGSDARVVFLTIGAETLLVRRQRDTYLATCRSIGQKLRANLVLMVEIPSGGVSRRLVEELVWMRPFFRIVGVAANAADLKDLPLASVNAASAGVEPRPSSEADVVRGLATRLHGQNCVFMVTETGTADIRRLLSAGADYVAFEASATAPPLLQGAA